MLMDIANPQSDNPAERNAALRSAAAKVRTTGKDKAAVRRLFQSVTECVIIDLAFRIAPLIHRGVPRDELDDLAQETLANLYSRVGSLASTGRLETLRFPCAYVRAMAVNELLRILGKRRRLLPIAPEVALELAMAPCAATSNETPESLRESMRAVDSMLKPQDRELLKLRLICDLDYRTVAGRLGISRRAARQRMHRLKAKLRTLGDTED